jgi:wobble nucleotide-excising tRNase
VLKGIKSISKYGVFSDYHPDGGEISFLKFNLFYGWNGTGKSTLSRVFDSLSGQQSTAFPEGDFKVTFENKDFTKDSINQSGIKIATFNQDFVKKNLDFDTHKAKSILYISEEKIEEKKKLEQKQEDLKNLTKELAQKNQSVQKTKDEISTDLTKIAKNVKNSFGLIQTNNTKFLNYNKTKLESFITSNLTNIKEENILSSENIEKNRLSAQSSQKPAVTKSVLLLTKEELETSLNQFKDHIGRSIAASQIQKLIDNDVLNNWIETGLAIHKKLDDKNCEFCGNKISEARIQELDAHFSNEYQALIDEVDKSLIHIAELTKKVDFLLPDSGDFYAELQDKVKKDKKEIDTVQKLIKDELLVIQEKLKEKKGNPFKSIKWTDPNLISDFQALDMLISGYNKDVEDHNKKTADFTTSVNAANDFLELHFICEQLQDGSLSQKKENLKIAESELEDIKKKQTNATAEVSALEAQLVNAAIAADVFNKELERFIGRSDISLEFKKETGGYQFTRNGKRELAANLSEGEKTAIAFIYFITKLNESGSNVGNTIVILDDPISSFDSTHLHHAFGFIRHHLGNALQIFVLTHNFEFFKLIRDWLKQKNSSDDSKKDKSKFFLIQYKTGEVRQSEVVTLPPMLLNYESEYHYIFGKTLAFKEKDNLSFEESYFVGNSSRKILEAFLAFKYPSYKADFAGLLGKACGDDKSLYHKVYSFINRYSHSKSLEVFSGGTDNIFAESQNIVGDVFQIIKNLDPNHYNEMEKICS